MPAGTLFEGKNRKKFHAPVALCRHLRKGLALGGKRAVGRGSQSSGEMRLQV